MAYNKDVPQKEHIIAHSQPDFLIDFSDIKKMFEINHVAFGDPDEGKHKFIQMPIVEVAPDTEANELNVQIGQQTKLNNQNQLEAIQNNLSFQRESGGDIVQLSAGTPIYGGVLGNGLLYRILPGFTVEASRNTSDQVSYPIWQNFYPNPNFTQAPFVVLAMPEFINRPVILPKLPEIVYRRDLSTATNLFFDLIGQATFPTSATGWSRFNIQILAIGI